ncbi:hypothetical protein BGZ72_002644, partial [Mortierella alpina]
MGRVNKRTVHLRRIRKERLLATSAPASTTATARSRPIESVVYVPVVKDVVLSELPTELKEWDEIFSERDTDYDAETDEEDWLQTSRTDNTWAKLQGQMHAAAACVGPSRQYHTGTSRSNGFRRKQVLKKASKGLFSFGFVRSNAGCESAPDEDDDMADDL